MSTTNTKAKPATAGTTETTEAPPKKRTLWEIESDQLALRDLIEECGGDVSDPRVEAAFDAMFLEVAKDEENKLEGYAQMIRMLEGEAAVAKAEADQFTMKARARTNQAKRMMDRVKLYLESQNRTEAATAKGRKFKIQKAGGMAPLLLDGADPEAIDPETKLPIVDPKFVVTERHIDNVRVRDALAAGEVLTFARLGERGTYVVLK